MVMLTILFILCLLFGCLIGIESEKYPRESKDKK